MTIINLFDDMKICHVLNGIWFT